MQYEDTDAGGIVYHAQYLAFAERARSAASCLGIDQSLLLSQEELAFVVRHIDIDFLQAAAFGDVLGVSSEIVKISGRSLCSKPLQKCNFALLLPDLASFVSL